MALPHVRRGEDYIILQILGLRISNRSFAPGRQKQAHKRNSDESQRDGRVSSGQKKFLRMLIDTLADIIDDNSHFEPDEGVFSAALFLNLLISRKLEPESGDIGSVSLYEGKGKINFRCVRVSLEHVKL